MIFYLLGILSYYKLANKPAPASICLLFFAVITVPPAATLFFFINKHWTFQLIAFAGGLFCWTFIEYFIHRFMMHGKEKQEYHKSSHFHHHVTGTIFTSRVKRILYSLGAIALTCFSIFISSYLFLLAGIATGLSLYSYMHVLLHKSWASKWIGGLQKFHMQHHFGQTEKCFGVTNTLWDKIFNTAGKTEKIAGAKSIELYFGKKGTKDLITHKQAV
ncbi:MAG TPA: sterol desaturase family protein [Chitinophagaceae bacterium]|jgi:sterol desaturase/sphingolipid hydroxylase (fatty acid hydroxylase superfamily)|nr:sterol desaturase family protein [Chitinophagaceae bacterium]